MFAGGGLKRIRSLKCIRPHNFHFPPVASLRSNDQHSPVPKPIQSTCSMIATTSRCNSGSPVLCISTVTPIANQHKLSTSRGAARDRIYAGCDDQDHCRRERAPPHDALQHDRCRVQVHRDLGKHIGEDRNASQVHGQDRLKRRSGRQDGTATSLRWDADRRFWLPASQLLLHDRRRAASERRRSA